MKSLHEFCSVLRNSWEGCEWREEWRNEGRNNFVVLTKCYEGCQIKAVQPEVRMWEIRNVSRIFVGKLWTRLRRRWKDHFKVNLKIVCGDVPCCKKFPAFMVGCARFVCSKGFSCPALSHFSSVTRLTSLFVLDLFDIVVPSAPASRTGVLLFCIPYNTFACIHHIYAWFMPDFAG
jgi:hypothetical protein